MYYKEKQVLARYEHVYNFSALETEAGGTT